MLPPTRAEDRLRATGRYPKELCGRMVLCLPEIFWTLMFVPSLTRTGPGTLKEAERVRVVWSGADETWERVAPRRLPRLMTGEPRHATSLHVRSRLNQEGHDHDDNKVDGFVKTPQTAVFERLTY